MERLYKMRRKTEFPVHIYLELQIIINASQQFRQTEVITTLFA